MPRPAVHFFRKRHGNRKGLNERAAQYGHPKANRDYLGRWSPGQSDDYLHTAQAIVFDLQDDVVQRMQTRPETIDETETQEALLKHLMEEEEMPEEDAAALVRSLHVPSNDLMAA